METIILMQNKGEAGNPVLKIGSVGTSSIMNLIQEAIRLTDGLESSVIYSRDPARGKAFAESAGVAESCADYSAMLERNDLDIICIASPNSLHFSQAKQALEHKKHVILEKPLVTTTQEAEMLFASARENGVFLFEAITTIYMPNYIACRAMLPALGKIHKAELCYAQYSSKYDAYLRGEDPNIFSPAMQGGALNDLGIYCVHVAVDLFGAPDRVAYEAECGPNGVDLAGTLTLDYPSLSCRLRTSKKEDLESGCRIEGENGWFAEQGPLNDFGACLAKLNGASIKIDKQHGENRMLYEMARFRDAILVRDMAFFEQAARQSLIACSILEKAHG